MGFPPLAQTLDTCLYLFEVQTSVVDAGMTIRRTSIMTRQEGSIIHKSEEFLHRYTRNTTEPRKGRGARRVSEFQPSWIKIPTVESDQR